MEGKKESWFVANLLRRLKSYFFQGVFLRNDRRVSSPSTITLRVKLAFVSLFSLFGRWLTEQRVLARSADLVHSPPIKATRGSRSIKPIVPVRDKFRTYNPTDEFFQFPIIRHEMMLKDGESVEKWQMGWICKKNEWVNFSKAGRNKKTLIRGKKKIALWSGRNIAKCRLRLE